MTKSRRGRVLTARTRAKDVGMRGGARPSQLRAKRTMRKPKAVVRPKPKVAASREASASDVKTARGSLKRGWPAMDNTRAQRLASKRPKTTLKISLPASPSRKKRAAKKNVDAWAFPVSSSDSDDSDSDSDSGSEAKYPTPSTPGGGDESSARSGASDSDEEEGSDDESADAATPARHSSRPVKPSPKAREMAALARPRRRAAPGRRPAAAPGRAGAAGRAPRAAPAPRGGVAKPRKPQARTRVSLSLGVGALLAAAGNPMATPPSSARPGDDDADAEDDGDGDGSPRRASVRAAKPSPKVRENLAAGRGGFAG